MEPILALLEQSYQAAAITFSDATKRRRQLITDKSRSEMAGYLSRFLGLVPIWNNADIVSAVANYIAMVIVDHEYPVDFIVGNIITLGPSLEYFVEHFYQQLQAHHYYNNGRPNIGVIQHYLGKKFKQVRH